MPGIPKETLERLREITLLDYLRHTAPDLLVHTGSAYRTPNGHSSLSISADGKKWNWFAGHVGGSSALDYLVKVEKMPFREAVEHLSTFSNLHLAELPKSVPVPSHPVKKFTMPQAARDPSRVIRYLTDRGIPADIVQQCIRQGSLYESYPHHNCVFIGKDTMGTPRFASLRGTLSGKAFRMDQPGSDKRFGFQYIPPGCVADRRIGVFESPIDALSYVALNRRYQINKSVPWQSLPCISLSGTAPAALLQYLRDHPKTDTIYLGLDNDEAGQKGCEGIARAIGQDTILSKQVQHIYTVRPPKDHGKDFNEMLQSINNAQQARASLMKQKGARDDR